MIRILSGIAFFLTSLFALASETATEVPPPVLDTDPTAMIIFVLLLAGSTAWFVWFIWSKEKQRRQQENSAK